MAGWLACDAMQTYFAGLEPAPVVPDKRHGSVLEGWRVSAVCEAPIERKSRRLDKAADVLAIWNEHVVRHPAYSPDQECFVVFCVNTQTRLLGWQMVTLGTVSSCLCHPREVFRPAIVAAASGVVCAHNHPSGDPAEFCGPEHHAEVARGQQGAGDLAGRSRGGGAAGGGSCGPRLVQLPRGGAGLNFRCLAPAAGRVRGSPASPLFCHEQQQTDQTRSGDAG